MDVFWAPCSEGNFLGIIVSKRTERRATRRNYIRRLIKFFVENFFEQGQDYGKIVLKLKNLPQEVKCGRRKTVRIFLESELKKVAEIILKTSHFST